MSSLQAQPLVFVLPEGHGGISGGNIYNAELIAALRRRGVSVELRTIGALGRGELASVRGVCFFDTLDLGELLAHTELGPADLQGLIVHHLPSLEPDLPNTHPARELEARALPLFDFYLSTSAFTTRLLAERGIEAQRLLTVPPGVAARTGGSARPTTPPLRAVLVGNLIPRKGVLELLEALRGHGDAPFQLRIVGRTDLDSTYARACTELLEKAPALARRTEIAGVVPYEQMGGAYAAAHVLVSAARMETYGMAIAEAKARGLPILAAEGGNVRHHFRDGHDGLLFATIPELARGLVQLARAPARLARLLDAAEHEAASAAPSWDDAAASLMRQLDAGVSGGLSRRPMRRSLA
jgi:glycosyltransferase involved in cell wall biosynthesis